MTSPPERISDPCELLPHVRKKMEEWLRALKEIGIEAKVIETYRTPERQQWLFDHGATKARPWKSWHQLRRAWDAYPVVSGKLSLSDSGEALAQLHTMGKVATEMGITWGGTFPSRDYGHFELRDGLTLEQAVEIHRKMEEIK